MMLPKVILLYTCLLTTSLQLNAFQLHHKCRPKANIISTSEPFRKTTIFRASENCDATKADDGINVDQERRDFMKKFAAQAATTFTLVSFAPSSVEAAIDVSGLRIEGSSNISGGGGNSIAEQLRSYDSSPPLRNPTPINESLKPVAVETAASKLDSSIAVSARRSSSAPPLLKKSTLTMCRFEENILAPPGSKKQFVYVSFEFPFDWLQLDRVLGGIQFVDQRNGDKVYLLQAKLPPDTNLETAPKKFFADSIFDPKGSISSGINIDEYKVSFSSTSSQIVNCPQSGACSSTRRRLKLKYATITGNGLRVERVALVDAYEFNGWAYMLMVTQNAVKFEAKGKERETVENIVNSFRLEA